MGHALLWFAGCFVVILLFRLAWGNTAFHETSKIWPVFKILYLVLIIAFLGLGALAIIKGDDPNFDWALKAMIWETVVTCIVQGIWVSQYKMDKSDNIAPKP